MATELFIASWNVENLYDVEGAERPPKVAGAMKSDLKGWDASLLEAKLRQLSIVIRSLNLGQGPDIICVCEVENRPVLEKLTQRIAADGGRSYSISHADTSDDRGIDVAFLYDPAVATAQETFQHWVVKRYATRELFQVNFRVAGKALVLVGNHWPSRSAGQYESEPYRMTAGETLSYWVQRIHEEKGKQIGVVVMGDFNDEPFNRSLQEYALAINDAQRLLNADNEYLLNLMWPILAEGRGTYSYKGKWNLLDQFLVSRCVVNGQSGWSLNGPARVEGITVMAQSKTNVIPHTFGIKPGERDTSGFSDHFPIGLTLRG